MPRKRAEPPIVRAAQPRPAAEGSLVYRPGARQGMGTQASTATHLYAPVVDAAKGFVQSQCSCGWQYGNRHIGLGEGQPRLVWEWHLEDVQDMLECQFSVAAALAATHDELRAEALHALALAPAAAYLRFLHAADPVAWRARLKAIYAACGGNAAEVARRLRLSRVGLAKLIASDDELRQAIAIRWPHAQRQIAKHGRCHTDQD